MFPERSSAWPARRVGKLLTLRNLLAVLFAALLLYGLAHVRSTPVPRREVIPPSPAVLPRREATPLTPSVPQRGTPALTCPAGTRPDVNGVCR